ncbi:peptidoglycan-associated lipoprotein [Aliidongia dinghuensis]|uniref:Peptidoglycan-associated lipoprotein n=1 Tax=Aliidongia dinghuensis TaxID=1867774 RepID=A0A8J3E1P2_9PROT|nr:peptidoglycan-associated lipoprotein Pal [Aliidongia dinghuensis]GGF02801.1 peptidoglycan-associated lipoprotein [Aliidongia dinghuensis]
MRTLIMDSLADARFGFVLVLLMALLAGCAEDQTVSTCGVPCQSKSNVGNPGGAKLAFDEAIHFDTDSSSPRADDKPVVARVAALLAAHPDARVVIEGHADERGTREYNLALGQRRAIAYRSALIAAGVSADRIIDTVSYGKERPVATGHDEAAWAQNRRALAVVQ